MIMAVAALGFTAPVFAQARSAVTRAELDAAVVERPVDVLDAVREFLVTDRVREVANRMGLSISEVSAAAASLDRESLDQIAEQAGIKDEVLAGGADTIVISATTVIIVLLILSLLSR
jgi:hypothetical protein